MEGKICRVARVTGLEPATSGVTGRRSNQLSYTRPRQEAGITGGGGDVSSEEGRESDGTMKMPGETPVRQTKLSLGV